MDYPAFNDIKDVDIRFNALYTAPEVLDEPLGATKSSDIYSLGIIFYRLIEGATPYSHIEEFLNSGRDSAADYDLLINKLCRNKDDDLLETYEVIVNIIVKMTKRCPEERYQSMSEVIAALPVFED